MKKLVCLTAAITAFAAVMFISSCKENSILADTPGYEGEELVELVPRAPRCRREFTPSPLPEALTPDAVLPDVSELPQIHR